MSHPSRWIVGAVRNMCDVADEGSLCVGLTLESLSTELQVHSQALLDGEHRVDGIESEGTNLTRKNNDTNEL